MTDKEIIKVLLGIISDYNTDGIYKDIIIGTKVTSGQDIVITHLTVKGERDKGTPFYCGSVRTHICEECWNNGKVYFATMTHEEETE